MGFAAIARVTEDRWITCASRDELAFGLKPGDATTLVVGHDVRTTELVQLDPVLERPQERVGVVERLPVVPADAWPEVVPLARWVLEHRGGHGCVREVCDAVWLAHAG